jgi:hypothetical protein
MAKADLAGRRDADKRHSPQPGQAITAVFGATLSSLQPFALKIYRLFSPAYYGVAKP